MDTFYESSMLIINENELLQKVQTHNNVHEITVQVPGGLRKRALKIADFLENAGYCVFISADPCYGACDLKEQGDLLIHVGHTRMYSPHISVIFAEVYDDYDFIPVLRNHYKTLPSPVGLLTTAQHQLQLPRVQSFLSENGIHPLLGEGKRTQFKGQILGCDLTAAVTIQDDVEAFLYLGTGIFHPLGAAIATKKSVFRIYDTFEEVSPKKLLKQRHALIFKASQSRKIGIVISTKKGQYRKKRAIQIRDFLEEKGMKTYLFVADEIRPDILHGCDAYVICACPRIALDDAALFEKPVLTCAEVPLLFEDKAYEMDMIL